MGKNFKNLTLLQQTYLLFGGFALLAIINYVVIKDAHNDYRSYEVKFQELQNFKNQTKNYKELSFKAVEDTSKSEDLKESIDYIESTLRVFKKGGELPFKKQTISAGSENLKAVIEKLEDKWTTIKKAQSNILFEPQKIDTTVQQSVMIQVNDSTTANEIQNKTISIENRVFRESANVLKLELQQFHKLLSELATVLTEDQKKSSDWLHLILAFFLAFNLVAIIVVLLLIKRNLFVPLNSLGKLISNEEFNKKSEYDQPNELGVISRSINHLVDMLNNSTDFVRKIGEGKINESITGVKESEVRKGSLQAALLNMRDQMKKMDEEEAERNWTTQGLAKFVDILRASDNVQELSDEIISSLVEYTNSNQGGIYIINEEDENDKFLELISLYAFDTKKYDTRKYRMGEGLVGQTFMEKKTIYLLEVPESYIHIGSGLGDANPTSILLVPLKIENDIYGVIELASFHEYKEYQIQFVEKLGESIASTIAGVKANQKTKQLLEESQQLTEQMQAQEEEMRQNMEELTATQEEMGRKEQAVNAQIDAINRSLGTCEYSADGAIINANRVFTDALGLDQSKISDNNFYSLHGGINLLDELTQGKSWSGWLEKNHSSGNTVELKSYFNPVQGEDGELLKIIEIVTQFERDQKPATKAETKRELEDVEEEMRQQMEELEITQEQLNAKLSTSANIINALSEEMNYVVFNELGDIQETSQAARVSVGDKNNIADILDSDVKSLTSADGKLKLKLKEKKIEIDATVRKITDSKGGNKFLIIWH
ncbi:GAF domain-containing protein [Fulvivirga lutea]|uniref:GAF domain-containing protein n=1 Tax=Fulvivirga lutea TaxID=2810512 RepID=A0A975A0X4_9BACT|nr:GAF domain-containing protein [Fulvivirga lutea]QSE97660.1 GAF domain-containing protein [Fulvivirga lutea]